MKVFYDDLNGKIDQEVQNSNTESMSFSKTQNANGNDDQNL